MSDKTVKTEWCIGRYTGDDAVRVIGQANQGVGYFLLDEGTENKKPFAIAAFLRPLMGPRPDHLSAPIVGSAMYEKLERKLAERQGAKREPITPIEAIHSQMEGAASVQATLDGTAVATRPKYNATSKAKMKAKDGERR